MSQPHIQGWYTEGDTIPPPSRSTSSLSYSVRETEADKTTTYANEWATVDPTKTTRGDVGFTPQRKPSRNTNFEREWTVRDEIQPLVEASNTRPFKSRFTHQWGSFSVKSSSSSAERGVQKVTREPVIEERPLKRPGYETPPPR